MGNNHIKEFYTFFFLYINESLEFKMLIDYLSKNIYYNLSQKYLDFSEYLQYKDQLSAFKSDYILEQEFCKNTKE